MILFGSVPWHVLNDIGALSRGTPHRAMVIHAVSVSPRDQAAKSSYTAKNGAGIAEVYYRKAA